MRLVIIVVLALLVLGGGGAGAYFFFMKPAEASVGKTEEHKEAKEDKKSDEATAFVKMDPLILPIIGARGISQSVTLVVALEVADDAKAEEVKHVLPRLKDAYIQDMYGVLSKQNAMPQGVLQVGMIKERLQKISQTVLGDDTIKNVLLQVVQQRAM